MTQKIVVNQQFPTTKNEIKSIIDNFDLIDDYIAKGTRNSIKKKKLESGKIATIKSFKIPNVVNKFVYRFFRKSKAERSFLYANKLIDLGFKTPTPIAYVENSSTISFLKSYYFSELVTSEITFRELVLDISYLNRNEILKQFTKFTFDLHEAGIEFLDHSPGNTLIKQIGENQYEFYLVDLNRMNFHNSMNFDIRMKNFSRLTPHKEMIEIMGKEYAKLINKPEQEVIEEMWNKTQEFQQKFQTKQARKKKLKAMIGKK
ncbi:Kdo domain containing protein [Empedobacter falsenii]|uniref:lipopolysaccharide kinase InaA family protein n=1 Tax=Empedobacter falsenii TaxID=343874 RepID=UPI0025765CA3|nr:lipopolysaccharide kinase InaA family protein [Empedobacter falsenii]MDM1297959.1 Kdo domain containing protein [Empedobacter falsenii]MDM1317966.1 Kdo domain containing protein [Empedobacter falsenii]